jgi:hypothetical protein
MSIEEATRLYRAGQYSAARTVAASLTQGPATGAALLLIAKAFAAESDVEGLSRVMGFAQQLGTPPEHSLFRILGSMLHEDKLYAPLSSLEHRFAEGSLLHPVALYHASCARMMQGDQIRAMRGFDAFRLMMPKYLNALPMGTDDAFNTMFRQATLVLPPEKTAERVAAGASMLPTQEDFRMIRQPAALPEGPVFLCSADHRYVRHFLERWLARLAPGGRAVHVHVVDPTPDSVALVERLAAALGLADRLSASTSRDTRGTSTSFACARFEVAPLLLDAFARPLIAIDIDSAATSALAALAANLPEADYAGFETDRCEPASVHPAGVMVFAPTASGTDFAGDLAAYCRTRLHLAVRLNWLLDQAALYSVLKLYAKTRPDFRYVALDRYTGRPMGDHIEGMASDEEKQAIKAESAGIGDARPSMTVESTWAP